MLVAHVTEVIEDFRFRWCGRFVVAPDLIALGVLLTLDWMSEATHLFSLEPIDLMYLTVLAGFPVCAWLLSLVRTPSAPPIGLLGCPARPTGWQGMLTVFPWHLFKWSRAETGEYHHPI